jgi:hypothetical protein
MTICPSREDGGGNTPSLYWEEDIDQTFRIYHLARDIWPRRWELTSKGETWDKWFTKHSGITLDEFSKWSNKHKLREKWKKSIQKSSYKTRRLAREK